MDRSFYLILNIGSRLSIEKMVNCTGPKTHPCGSSTVIKVNWNIAVTDETNISFKKMSLEISSNTPSEISRNYIKSSWKIENMTRPQWPTEPKTIELSCSIVNVSINVTVFSIYPSASFIFYENVIKQPVEKGINCIGPRTDPCGTPCSIPT